MPLAWLSLRNSCGTKWGSDLCDHYTYDCWRWVSNEGISQEVISLAGKLKLKKLIVIWDDNGITIDGGVDLSCNTTRSPDLNRLDGLLFLVMLITQLKLIKR